MSRPRVLIVEDDVEIADVLRRSLRVEGYDVKVSGDGNQALDEANVFEPDAVVLDLGLPGLDGVEVSKRLRAGGDVPILILTARDTLENRVEGLDSGADDYLVKPFEREELLARLRALLRRGEPVADGVLQYADLRRDPATREVRRGERELDLTKTEFSLLELFMRHPRQVLTRGQIFEAVWGYDFGPTSNSLEVYVGYLRRKTEAGGEPRLIQTARGVGYALREK